MRVLACVCVCMCVRICMCMCVRGVVWCVRMSALYICASACAWMSVCHGIDDNTCLSRIPSG